MTENDKRIGERVELFTGEDKQWYFRRVAANNETVASSEGYNNFGDAETEAYKLFPGVARFVQASDGSWTAWNLEGDWRAGVPLVDDDPDQEA